MTELLKNKLLNILKTITLIILLLIFPSLPLLFFKIDLTEFSNIQKTLYLLIADILLIIIFISIYKKDIKKDFKNYYQKNFFKNFKISIKYWLLGLGAMMLCNYIIIIFVGNSISGNEQAVRELIDKVPLFMLFETLIYAPITEEIIFRKSIKDIINNKKAYIIISGLVFGLVHVAFSITDIKEIFFILPYSIIGMIFASCYYKTNNIFSTITSHSLHNSLTLILYIISKMIR